MKIICLTGSPLRGTKKKWGRIMRLTLFLIIGFWLSSSASSYSQNTRMGIKLKNGTIAELMKYVEDNSEFVFLYKNEDLDIKKKVSIELENASIDQILAAGFEGQNVGWDVYDRQIVIHRAEKLRLSEQTMQQQRTVSGAVTDQRGLPLPGVTVVVKGTTTGTVTNPDGNFTLTIPQNAETLQFSFVGMRSQEIPIEGRGTFTVVMEEETIGIEEVVAVGYGVQKKSDITGTVASLSQDRLEIVPNLNIAQAIQGAIPGVMIQTGSAGASPSEAIIVRGRNSILANNVPLIVVDGIPYEGNLSDLNPNDVQSIEILKDASAAAIYGSRGSNGVVLITTKLGLTSKPVFKYDVKYSFQNPTNIPEVMDGGEFYNFKMVRGPQHMTEHEIQNFEAGKWIDWYELGLRNGRRQEQNVSVIGGTDNIKYFVSGNFLDIKGIALNDDFLRVSNRINLDIDLFNWFSIGTRTQLSYNDQSGIAADFYEILRGHPLTTPFDENGNLTIYPWPGNEDLVNPLEQTIWDNKSHRYQVISNNYALINIPFIPGLNYRINTGVNLSVFDEATYIGRNSTSGLKMEGGSETQRSISDNTTVENILSFSRDFNEHTLFITSLLSFEKNNYKSTRISAQGFPHDFITNYSIPQAKLVEPNYLYNSSSLISQMLRINYSFDSRYLITITGRRDGFSGFGSNSKWGLFPSVALGWNIANEDFFPLKDLINNLKFRTSYGLNGNQAVGAYQSISRLRTLNNVDGSTTLAGYEPRVLGQDNLGWESSRTLNLGLDFGIKNNRFSGDINFYKTNTFDLLLNRTISGVHGITSITQNIGKTKNTGLELLFNSRNISKRNFTWLTSFNMAYVKNKIISLYGELDEKGNEIDDISNAWFIGQPVRVNYDFLWLGTWQLGEEEEAAKYGSIPGFVKLKDVNSDGKIDGDDRVIIGQRDPKFLWGLNNIFSIGQFSLNFFIHGVHGITKRNELYTDGGVHREIRRNTIVKDWWTPDNPTNKFVMNHENAEYMGGQNGRIYQDASFIRVKDISISYDLPIEFINNLKLRKAQLFTTGRNLLTFTKWSDGLDPELDDQQSIPLQKEYLVGIILEF